MKRKTEQRFLDTVFGALSGVVATGPMTVAMILWHRRLPFYERYPLPPRQIVMKVARETGVAEHLSKEARSAATMVGHFGYGGGVGALYGSVTRDLPIHPALKGMGFGLFVWITSYLGVLPGLGVLEGAHQHPVRRNLLMIGVHLIWGLALGLMTSVLREEARTDGHKPFSAAHLPHLDTPEKVLG